MRRMALFVALLLAPIVLAGEFAIPEFDKKWVNDFASLLKDNEVMALMKKLDDLHKQTGKNFIVVTIPSLGDLTIEDFSMKLAEKWKVGKKGEDNGLVYIVAPNEHKARLEVGYGLEGVLPDGKCGRLINVANPFYRQKNWYQGIDAVVSGVIAELASPAQADAVPAGTPNNEEVPAGLIVFLVIGGAALVVVLIVASSRSQSSSYSSYSGSGSSGYIPPIIPYGGSSRRSSSTEDDRPLRRRDDDDDSSSSSSSSSSDFGSSDTGGSFGGGGASSSW